ncbi:Lysylphosphatidylglycerol synthase TM region [uncultured archaeon]|nr:Lysylphosphatidylglycerol synthase TM region [uncultured archaeon]
MEQGKGSGVLQHKINWHSQALQTAIKAAVSIAALWLLFSWVGMGKISESLAGFDAFFILPALLLLAVILAINAVNLKILTECFGKISMADAFWYSLSARAAGFVMPGKIGEFSYGAMMSKQGVSIAEGMAVVAVDKAMTFLALSIAGSFGIASLFPAQATLAIGAIAVAWVAVAAGIMALGNKGFTALVERFFGKGVAGFSLAVKKISGNRLALAKNFALTVIRMLLQAVFFLALFAGFGSAMGFAEMVFVVAVSIVISHLPFTLSGLGAREGAFVYLCTLYGAPAAAAGSVALLSLAMDCIFTAVAVIAKPAIQNILGWTKAKN